MFLNYVSTSTLIGRCYVTLLYITYTLSYLGIEFLRWSLQKMCTIKFYRKASSIFIIVSNISAQMENICSQKKSRINQER